MRWLSTALVAALTAFGSSSTALAQAVTFTNVTRTGSPRSMENGGRILTRDEPLGARDCPCESWTFEGTIMPQANARSLEWWVGTSATACATAINRFPAMNATCWPLDRLGINATLPIASNRFAVTIPARWIVDPLTQTCTPPASISAGSNVHVTAMLRPPDDMVPVGTVPVTVSVARPQSVQVVTASGAESSAIVEWQHTRAEDGGIATVPANTAGYYVLCLPRIVGYDAGLTATACAPIVTDSGTDSGVVTDSGVDPDASAITDSGVVDDTGVATMTDSGSSPGSCGSESLPADFDPNDDSQLALYACSPLLASGTSRYTVQGLTNGASYRFAVIAQDNAGSRSTPSTFTSCVSPEQVTDFWERYRQNPGMTAAPGCSTAPSRFARSMRGGWIAAGLAVAAIAAHRINARKDKRS